MTSSRRDEDNILFPESKGKITVDSLKELLKAISDVQYKEVLVQDEWVTIIYLSLMVETKTLKEFVYDQLKEVTTNPQDEIKISEVVQELPEVIHDILDGYTIPIFSKLKLILKINTYRSPQSNDEQTNEIERAIRLVERLNDEFSQFYINFKS
jgi:hypothetical protein